MKFDPKKTIEDSIMNNLKKNLPDLTNEIQKLKFLWEGDIVKFDLSQISETAQSQIFQFLQRYKQS